MITMKNRKLLVRVSIVTFLLALVATVCGLLIPGKITSPIASAPPPGDGHEAPALTVLVQAGQLPLLEERLPDSPLVVTPVESIGEYGGTWHMLILPSADDPSFIRSVGYENLVRWSPDWQEIIPNIAGSYEVNSLSTEYTFHLRPGMKWSDGTPFTTRDIQFWFEDVIQNSELTPTPPIWLTSIGKSPELVVADDYTFTFKYAQPNGILLAGLATPDGADPNLYPYHWAKQFLPKYNPDIATLLQEGGYHDWVEMWNARVGTYMVGTGRWIDLSRPTLDAWVQKTPYDGSSSQIVFERNPYYWKVDTQGDQLPYIDRVVFTVVSSTEAMVPKVLNGEVDMQYRSINGTANRALYYDNQAQGGYHFFTLTSNSINVMVINLNLCIDDPVKREIFNNINFRIGLSYAIDRQEIIDTLLMGQGTPWQAAPLPATTFYDEEMGTQYTEYDPVQANRYLDLAGYLADEQGRRIGPDGKPIAFTVEVPNSEPALADMLGFVQKNWHAVGIDINVKVEERSFFYANKAANLHEANVWPGTSSYPAEVMLDPRYFLPFGPDSNWAARWSDWVLGKSAGAKYTPPVPIIEEFGLYGLLMSTADTARQEFLMKQILGIARDNFWVIGIAYGPDGYGIVKNNFHNVPASMPSAWLYPTFAPTNPEQYYIEQP